MDTVYIAFGRSIFAPRDEITDDLYVHECVHLKQMKMSYLYGILWWIKYILSKDFRYSQELPAYVEQLDYLIEHSTVKDKNNKLREYNQWVHKVAEILSSDMYNNMATYDQALSDTKTLLWGLRNQNQ